MRRVLTTAAFALAGAVVLATSLLFFGLTQEYGPHPNGGGFREAVVTVLRNGLPVALVVAGLVALGSWGRPRRTRLRLVAGGAVLTVAALGLAVLLGAQQWPGPRGL